MTTHDQHPDQIDLEAYLDRIGYGGPRRATLPVFEALHRAHVGSIPFENLDVVLGRPIDLDLASLQAKLVDARRGGYCFEQNTLFATALRAVGFDVTPLEARVRPPGVPIVLPRSHMVLRVDVDGSGWLADVGFGGEGPLLPVPLDGTESIQPLGRYRVVEESGAGLVAQAERHGSWSDLYSFTLQPALAVDYAVTNHYTSTHPTSVFVRTLTVQLATADCRHVLRGLTYTHQDADGDETREVSGPELHALLRDPFGIDLDEDEVERALRATGLADLPEPGVTETRLPEPHVAAR